MRCLRNIRRLCVARSKDGPRNSLWYPEDYLPQSDEYVTFHTRVVCLGTYLEDDGTSYIVTLLGMTVQEQDGFAAVLDFIDQSYNGYVDRREALHCTARESEKHACQMFRLDLIQTGRTSKRACTSITRLRYRLVCTASGSVSGLDDATMYEAV